MRSSASLTIPADGFTALGEAYEEAYRRLEKGTDLDEAAERLVQDPDFDLWAEGTGREPRWLQPDPDAVTARRLARGRVERLMRDAMADGLINTFVVNALTGGVDRIIDHEAWRHSSEFTGLGIDSYIDHLVCPGPDVGNDRPVFVLTTQFAQFVEETEVALNAARSVGDGLARGDADSPQSSEGQATCEKRSISDAELKRAYGSYVQQQRSAWPYPSRDDDVVAIRVAYPDKVIQVKRVYAERGQQAPKEWTEGGRRKSGAKPGG
jgi:hypothetical protein